MAIVAMGRYGGFELSYGSDADVLFVHDPVPDADPQVASSYAQAVANEVRRLLGAARARPGARGRRRPAARGQAGRRWCGPSTPTPPTTRSGRRSGRRRRCCAPTRSSATSTCGAGSRRLIDPLRYPPEGICAGRRRRGAPDQGPRRRRAAAARRRPAHPPQARPRRARRHRVDRPAAADAVRRRGAGAAHLAHPRGAGRRPRGRT